MELPAKLLDYFLRSTYEVTLVTLIHTHTTRKSNTMWLNICNGCISWVVYRLHCVLKTQCSLHCILSCTSRVQDRYLELRIEFNVYTQLKICNSRHLMSLVAYECLYATQDMRYIWVAQLKICNSRYLKISISRYLSQDIYLKISILTLLEWLIWVAYRHWVVYRHCTSWVAHLELCIDIAHLELCIDIAHLELCIDIAHLELCIHILSCV